MLHSLRQITAADRDDVARLIYHSTNRYYESLGKPPIFLGDELSPAVFVDVYRRLDGNAAWVAIDDASGTLVGSCFYHPRETHVSLGIMNVHPEHFGHGIARRLLSRILDEAGETPVRLVSSCQNLDSYSLYNRAGFTPYCTYQDMYLEVPDSGLPRAVPNGPEVRDATPDDVEAMAALEEEVSGIRRTQDYRYFIENPDGLWGVSVIDAADGSGLAGWLASCSSPAANMIGPGVSRTEADAGALLHRELNRQRGRTPVFLLPVTASDLVRAAYSWGARNCEMHVGQAKGGAIAPRGITLPTFLPESG